MCGWRITSQSMGMIIAGLLDGGGAEKTVAFPELGKEEE